MNRGILAAALGLVVAAAACHTWNRKPNAATSDCLAQCPPERTATRADERLGPDTRSECEKRCWNLNNR